MAAKRRAIMDVMRALPDMAARAENPTAASVPADHMAAAWYESFFFRPGITRANNVDIIIKET